MGLEGELRRQGDGRLAGGEVCVVDVFFWGEGGVALAL